jgi:hypothetical protein
VAEHVVALQVVCERFGVVVGFLGNRIANLCPFFRLDELSFESLMPFEPLIRAASLEEQFALHQSLDYTRRGFLEETF